MNSGQGDEYHENRKKQIYEYMDIFMKECTTIDIKIDKTNSNTEYNTFRNPCNSICYIYNAFNVWLKINNYEIQKARNPDDKSIKELIYRYYIDKKYDFIPDDKYFYMRNYVSGFILNDNFVKYYDFMGIFVEKCEGNKININVLSDMYKVFCKRSYSTIESKKIFIKFIKKNYTVDNDDVLNIKFIDFSAE